MNRKKIIQFVIIIIAFGGSGFVLYNGFFKNTNNEALKSLPGGPIPAVPGSAAGALVSSTSPAPSAPGTPRITPVVSSVVDIQNLLPYGDKLDYSVLDKNSLQPTGLVKLKLDYNRDVGIPEQNLIAPHSGQ
jgi:hypothetical protein